MSRGIAPFAARALMFGVLVFWCFGVLVFWVFRWFPRFAFALASA
jgi:hypothetical protein